MKLSITPLNKIEMNNPQPSFWSILYRTIISHTVTYFAIGVIGSILLDYSTRMMRPHVARSFGIFRIRSLWQALYFNQFGLHYWP